MARELKPVIARLAPTPSGYLHLGNAVNFLWTWRETRLAGGKLFLRIDDIDGSRVRDAYLDDIFSCLEWLDIDIDGGPSGAEEFLREHSQQLKMDRYREALARLPQTYACRCSRKQLEGHKIYPRTCWHTHDDVTTDPVCWRVHVPDSTDLQIENHQLQLQKEMGDFVVWTKDDRAAYQLASVVDDHEMQTSLIVRGQDLLFSSAAQAFLAQRLDFDGFSQVEWVHHPLLLTKEGKKLSKSDASLSLKHMREQGTSAREVYQKAAELMGLGACKVHQLSDLLN